MDSKGRKTLSNKTDCEIIGANEESEVPEKTDPKTTFSFTFQIPGKGYHRINSIKSLTGFARLNTLKADYTKERG